jgi:hypothetical protein
MHDLLAEHMSRNKQLVAPCWQGHKFHALAKSRRTFGFRDS